MKVLIVGALGRVGHVLTRELGDRFEFVLGDVRGLDEPGVVPLDVCEPAQVENAVRLADTIVYLSIARDEDLGHGVEYAQACFDVQVKGLYNVLSAAEGQGNKRVVYAGSVSALSGYPDDMMIGSEHPPKSSGVYGITKGLGEDLCRTFHEGRNLPVAILRLGHVYCDGVGKRGPVPNKYCVYETDVARAFGAVISEPEPPWALIHVVGDNEGRNWDLEEGKRLYGWEPEFTFDPDGKPHARG